MFSFIRMGTTLCGLGDDDLIDEAYISACVQALERTVLWFVVAGQAVYYRNSKQLYVGKPIDLLSGILVVACSVVLWCGH